MMILLLYISLFVVSLLLYRFLSAFFRRHQGEEVVTMFGDEKGVTANRSASVLSILSLFLLWAAFTGSALSPLHVPGPYVGQVSFSYDAANASGEIDQATVMVNVQPADEKPIKPVLKEAGDGFAKDDVAAVNVWRSVLIRIKKNDQGGRDKDYKVIAVNGVPIAVGEVVDIDAGELKLTHKGSLSFTPSTGWQMEPIWLPPPEAVWNRFIEIAGKGYQNVTLLENVGWSLIRVVAGFFLGCLVGIPLGYAMGLSSWFRGWFDPIVEFMRPVPPLALIPLIIIWFGIWETGKISLLFLAALWVMTIAARSGVSGINLAKIHAAYSLGANRWQVLRHVIIPNSLPEIFTGARVAMGVCWGTVVAAELVAAEKGAGKMIIAASKFQQTDIVIMGIILIGIIGYAIDVLMRKLEVKLVPWKGH